jgi:hypothetical protein
MWDEVNRFDWWAEGTVSRRSARHGLYQEPEERAECGIVRIACVVVKSADGANAGRAAIAARADWRAGEGNSRSATRLARGDGDNVQVSRARQAIGSVHESGARASLCPFFPANVFTYLVQPVKRMKG